MNPTPSSQEGTPEALVATMRERAEVALSACRRFNGEHDICDFCEEGTAWTEAADALESSNRSLVAAERVRKAARNVTEIEAGRDGPYSMGLHLRGAIQELAAALNPEAPKPEGKVAT